jgi:hypothetical protein
MSPGQTTAGRAFVQDRSMPRRGRRVTRNSPAEGSAGRPRSLRPPRRWNYTITGYKFGGGPRNFRISTPSLGPRVFPELRQAGLAASRGGAAHPHPAAGVAPSLAVEARVSSWAAPLRWETAGRSLLVDGKQLAACCASRPCGVCVVARCPFFVGEERECWARRFSAGEEREHRACPS